MIVYLILLPFTGNFPEHAVAIVAAYNFDHVLMHSMIDSSSLQMMGFVNPLFVVISYGANLGYYFDLGASIWYLFISLIPWTLYNGQDQQLTKSRGLTTSMIFGALYVFIAVTTFWFPAENYTIWGNPYPKST